MLNLLNQPYPVEEPVRLRLARAFWIGLFVGLFLLTFQPFGLLLWETPLKTGKLLGFGVITFLVTSVNYVVIPWLFPAPFTDKRWTIGREIAFVTLNILLIGLANRWYMAWLLDSSVHGPDLLGMVLVTFLIGLFPVAASVMVSYTLQLRRYARAAAALPVHSPDALPSSTQAPLTLMAENDRDSLTLSVNDLLYVESSDNYSTVMHLRNGQPVKTLMRSSLSRLEAQVEAIPDVRNSLVRCHRSYLVNLSAVEKVTGNAQGYKLHLHADAFQVPVARRYNESVVRYLKSL